LVEEKDRNLPKRYRKPNALKHGGFSSMELFPWENGAAFEKLHGDLVEQYQPRGPVQEDCIRTIASCIWRKRRVRDKRQFDTQAALERVENNVLWQDPPPLLETDLDVTKYQLTNRSIEPPMHPREDYQQLLGFSTSLYRDRSKASLLMAIKFLPEEFRTHLEEKVLKYNCETTQQWIVALKREVDGVLLPMVRKRQPESDRYFETAAKLLTDERTLADLDLEERFDAAMDRALKRFFSLKTADQLQDASKPRIVNSSTLGSLSAPHSADAQ
jgi:hypothetical protein